MSGESLRPRIAVLAVVLAAAGCEAPAPARAGAAVYARWAVAADHPAASEAGAAMLRQGGNAVDAAVAASFCLSVVRPYSCGIGGGGFMIIHAPPARPGDPPVRVAIDYRETAPAAVGPDYFVGRDALASRDGAHAAAVPGTVAGLLLALERYGTLPRETVLAPAIRAAEDGFVTDAHFVETLHDPRGRLIDPERRKGLGRIWREQCRDGRLRAGDVVRNPEQARALRSIAARGAEALYRGPIGEAIVDAVRAGGGAITRADLAAYRPRVTAPLVGRYGPYEILAMPPPSSGGVATLQVLGILERLGARPAPRRAAPRDTWRRNGPAYVHLVAEAMKHAFADRARWLADPDFAPVPTAALLDPAYLDGRATTISATRPLPPADCGRLPPPDDGGTSHLSVVDADGMAVACTETINLPFGCLLAVPGYGFALNDEMDDFTTARGEANAFGLRQSDWNLPAAGKRPLSSMSPTIVLRGGRPVLVAGASGGPRIITGTLQVLLNCLLHGMEPADAVAAPRFHHQWTPDVLEFEEGWTDEAAIAAVAALGHATGRRKDVGNVQVVRAGPDGLRAASDPRKGGRPAGD